MKKRLKILCSVIVLLATFCLQANEAAIRKTITDCINAHAAMQSRAFNYWCPDGFLMWNGGKYTVNDMKWKICPVIEDYAAWDYDSLINIRSAAGRMSQADRKKALEVNRFKKKALYVMMKKDVAAAYFTWKGLASYVQRTLKIHSVFIKSEQAEAVASVTNPKTLKPETRKVNLKKINGAWKIYSVE